jgi:hypothetical protein
MMAPQVLRAYKALLAYKDSQVLLVTWVIQVPLVPLVFKVKLVLLALQAYRAKLVPQVLRVYKALKEPLEFKDL